MGLRHVNTLVGDSFYFRPVDADLCEFLRPQPFIGVHENVQEVAIRSTSVEVLAFITLPYGYPDRGSIDDLHWASIHSSPPGQATQMPAITEHRFGAGKVIYSAVPLERGAHHSSRHTFQWLIDRLLDGRAAFRAKTYDHVWLTVFHQPGHKRFVLHLLNYPAELPAVPIRDIQLEFGHGLDFKFHSLRRIPDNDEIAFLSDGKGHFKATIDALDDYAMLLLGYA